MEKSITQAMGVNDKWFEDTNKVVIDLFKSSESDLVSDVLLDSAKDVREDCFGEVTNELSDYEKKLLLTGYLVGLTMARGRMGDINPIEMLFRSFLESRGKEQEEGDE